MEALERAILARLRIPDPYLARDADGRRLTAHARQRPAESATARAERRAAICRCRLAPSARERGDSWLDARAARAVRLEAGLDPRRPQGRARAMPPGEAGFSPEESRDAQEHPGAARAPRRATSWCRAPTSSPCSRTFTLGELIRVFERAGHSRLVVYNDTLDDPVGMVHIRDLIAYMTRAPRSTPEKNAKRKKPLPAGLDLKAINLAMPLSATKIVREILFVPPSMRGDRSAGAHAGDAHPSRAGDRRIWRHRRPRARSRTSSSRSSAKSPTSTTRTSAGGGAAAGRHRFLADARASLEDVVGDRRHRFRPRRRGRGGRHARRLSGDARRPRCRCAASSFPAPACSSSRCSTPTRAASSACASCG